MKSIFVSNSRPDQLVIQANPSDIAAFVAEATASGVDVRQSVECTCGGTAHNTSTKKPTPLGIPSMTFNRSETAKPLEVPGTNSVKRGLGIPTMRF